MPRLAKAGTDIISQWHLVCKDVVMHTITLSNRFVFGSTLCLDSAYLGLQH